MKNLKTIAFQCEMEVYFNHLDKALTILKPLAEGKYQDDERLCYEYSHIFYCYLIQEHNMENAGQYYKLMEKLRKKLRIHPPDFEDTVLYLVLTDLDAAWNFYKKEAPYQAVTTIALCAMYFARASVIMMRSLAGNGIKQVHIRFSNKLPYYREDDCYQTDELAEYFNRAAKETAKKFDARNGNQKSMDEYRKYMTVAKLWDED